MGFIRKYGAIVSAILALLICFAYLLLMGLWANSKGADGMGIMLYAIVPMPFLSVLSYKFLYKLFRADDAESTQEGFPVLQKRVNYFWVIFIVSVPIIYVSLVFFGIV